MADIIPGGGGGGGGGGSGDMLGANNLSEITSASAARSNLGLGSAAVESAASFATSAQGAKADTAVQPARTVNGHALSADVTVTKSDVGLGNADNTSDANKPVSTAQQTALDLKVNATRTVNGHALSADVTVSKSDVGLGNADNTSDANKPVSTAQQTALDLKVTANGGITGATKTKITYDTKGLVTAGADATTADIADSSNKRYVTDAHLVILGNTSGTNTGNQTITLTGDVTGSGTGSFAATIANSAVTLAKMADMATASFLGRNTAGTGAPEVLSVATAKTMLGLTGTNSGDQTITLTGNVTGSGTGSFATTIAAGVVTEAMQTLADNTTGDVSTTKHGYAPKAPNDTTKFLRGDGTWAAPAAGGSTPKSIIHIQYEVASAGVYAQNVTGTGAVALSSTQVQVSTGATAGSNAATYPTSMSSTGSENNFWDNNPLGTFSARLSSDTSTNFISWVMVGRGNTTPSSSAVATVKHAAFILDTTVLYASNADGSTQTLTDISSGVTVTDTHEFLIEMSSGASIKFYVDKTLKSTSTTNLPSGAPNSRALMWGFGIANDGGVTTSRRLEMNIGTFHIESDAR